jgi:hypothetical protein
LKSVLILSENHQQYRRERSDGGQDYSELRAFGKVDSLTLHFGAISYSGTFGELQEFSFTKNLSQSLIVDSRTAENLRAFMEGPKSTGPTAKYLEPYFNGARDSNNTRRILK